MEGGGGQRTRAVFARILRRCGSEGGARTVIPGKPPLLAIIPMFSWFKKQKPALDREETESRLERIERVIRDLRLDWDQTYDRFRLLHARLSKRIERDEELRREAEATTTEGEDTKAAGAPGVPPPRRMILRSRLISGRR